jgi:hypothetical protein
LVLDVYLVVVEQLGMLDQFLQEIYHRVLQLNGVHVNFDFFHFHIELIAVYELEVYLLLLLGPYDVKDVLRVRVFDYEHRNEDPFE